MRCRRHFISIGWIGMMLAVACSEPNGTKEDRLVGTAAYDSALQSVSDSSLGAMPPIDSLFLAHDVADFRWSPADSESISVWVDSLMSSLTLEEKVGQLFIVHLGDRRLGGLIDHSASAIRDVKVGGFLVPRLLDPHDVFRATQRLQRISKIPLFFAADYERGVGRFNNALTELPSNMAIGATRDTLFASAAGRLTAIEARTLGINLLFAPVVDVNNNPDNPIINIRSFGEDPELVGRMAAAFVREAQDRGLLTTLKHFPGHGNTSVDSHSRMGTIRGDSAALEQTELKPYRIIFSGDSPSAAVMSAHLWIEALEPDPLPATFSSDILGGLLRRDMSFDGIVITDDIRMGALRQGYGDEQRLLHPLLAGADIILTPANLSQAVRIVRDAVQDGRLGRDKLDSSVRRILRTKAEAGLHENRFSSEDRLSDISKEPLGSYIAQAIADRSITLLKTHAALPLRPHSQRIFTVHLTNYHSSESIQAAIDHFDKIVDESPGSVRFDEEPSEEDIGRAVAQADGSDVIVLTLYLRLQAGRGEAGLFPMQTRLVHQLLELEKPVILVTFGNPYAASLFRDADGIIVAYDQALETAHAAARVLLGKQPAPGRLPITVEPYAYGSGIDHVTNGSGIDRVTKPTR